MGEKNLFQAICTSGLRTWKTRSQVLDKRRIKTEAEGRICGQFLNVLICFSRIYTVTVIYKASLSSWGQNVCLSQEEHSSCVICDGMLVGPRIITVVAHQTSEVTCPSSHLFVGKLCLFKVVPQPYGIPHVCNLLGLLFILSKVLGSWWDVLSLKHIQKIGCNCGYQSLGIDHPGDNSPWRFTCESIKTSLGR